MNVERQLDPEALGDHIDRLYRAAWSLCGSREEAEDLVQETFERVLRRPRFLRSEDDLGYLLRVLRNTFFSPRRAAGAPPADDAAARRPRPDRGPQRAGGRVPAPVGGAVRGDLAAARRLPRRAGGDRRRRALLPGGGEGAAGPRGDDHDPAAPRAPARRRRPGQRQPRERQCQPSGSPPGPSTPPASAARRP